MHVRQNGHALFLCAVFYLAVFALVVAVVVVNDCAGFSLTMILDGN